MCAGSPFQSGSQKLPSSRRRLTALQIPSLYQRQEIKKHMLYKKPLGNSSDKQNVKSLEKAFKSLFRSQGTLGIFVHTYIFIHICMFLKLRVVLLVVIYRLQALALNN